MSVLCGCTPEGVPVGVQIVGRYQDELGVVRFAHAFEHTTGCWQQAPSSALSTGERSHRQPNPEKAGWHGWRSVPVPSVSFGNAASVPLDAAQTVLDAF